MRDSKITFTSMINFMVLHALGNSMFPECLYNNLLYTLILPPNSSLSYIPNFSSVHIAWSMNFLLMYLQAFHRSRGMLILNIYIK